VTISNLGPNSRYPDSVFCGFLRIYSYVKLDQGCPNARHQVAQASKFCTAVLNICVSSVWNLRHVTHPAPRILGDTCIFRRLVYPWVRWWLLCVKSFLVYTIKPSYNPVLHSVRRRRCYKVNHWNGWAMSRRNSPVKRSWDKWWVEVVALDHSAVHLGTQYCLVYQCQ
jgi:hypothetical protein